MSEGKTVYGILPQGERIALVQRLFEVKAFRDMTDGKKSDP